MDRSLIVIAALVAILSASGIGSTPDEPTVSVLRTPRDGIQPQVVEKGGIVHLLYFTGNAAGGDLNYVWSRDHGRTFSEPIRVNSQAGSAIATGNMRGGQIAVGRCGEVHVAWTGSGSAMPRAASNSAPVLYSRMNTAGTAFEAQRSLNQASWGADGVTLAADSANSVYVIWHAQPPNGKNESDRRVWMAKSADGGRTFGGEKAIYGNSTGVCGCCGSRALAAPDGSLYILFRSATQLVHRDIWLLSSADHGASFNGSDVSQWNIGACVMSTAALLHTSAGILAGWESKRQVYLGRVAQGSNKIGTSIGAPGPSPEKDNRKYPALAVNSRGQILLAWTEHMAWKKGGSAAWQVYDKGLQPEGKEGTAEGVPVWGIPATFARPDGSFVVMF
jgi:hypothetical protein